MIPLLSELGAEYLSRVPQGTPEREVLVFHMRDLDDSEILHACLVCQFPNPRQHAGKNEYLHLLHDLQALKSTDIIDPASKRSRIPDRVWVATGNAIPQDSILGAQQFMAEIKKTGIKLMDAPVLQERLRKKMPSIYTKYCRPTDSYDWIASTLLSEHRERNVLDPGSTGYIDDVYVQLDVAPSNGYFRRIINKGLVPRVVALPSTLSHADGDFLRRFVDKSYPSPGSAERSGSEDEPLATMLAKSIQFAATRLRTDFQKLLRKGTQEQLKASLSAFLAKQRGFEADVKYLVDLLGSGLFQAQTMKIKESFSLSNIAPVDLLKLDGDVIVYGDPGSGKTFHAKMAFKEATKRGMDAVYYPCAAFRARDGGIVSNVTKFWLQRGFHNSQEIEAKLRMPGACLILDGLDEAVADSTRFITEISTIRSTYTNLKLLLTCRSALDLKIREEFLSVELEGFSEEQLKEFIRKWFAPNRHKSDSLIEFLDTHSAIREAASSPMIASVLVVLHDHNYELPNTYAELYNARFDLLFERWDKGKNVARNIYKKADKLALLQDLAFHLHKKRKRFFSNEDFAAAFDGVLRAVLNPAHCEAMKQEILVSNGAILREGPEVFSFGHLSNQEFLAACFIHTRSKVSFLAQQLEDPWWNEVAKFFASITGDVSLLVEKAHESNGIDLLTHRKLLEELVRVGRYTSPAVVHFLQDLESEAEDAQAEADEENQKRTISKCIDALLKTEGKDKAAHKTLVDIGESAVSDICDRIVRVAGDGPMALSIPRVNGLEPLFKVLGELGKKAASGVEALYDLDEALADSSFVIDASRQRVANVKNRDVRRIRARVQRLIRRIRG